MCVDDNLVIDIDKRNGGFESYEKLCKATGIDYVKESAFVVETGGGGLHIYFRNEPPISLLSHLNDYKGIDFKVSGYVCGCGSIHKSVITSYSIHYTKLYEVFVSIECNFYFQFTAKIRINNSYAVGKPCVLFKCHATATKNKHDVVFFEIVITSYSIHYTKLYDLNPFSALTISEQYATARITKISSDTWLVSGNITA